MTQRDWFTEGFGQAVADIRQKLVEEPWFGRAVTPANGMEPSLSETLGWTLPGNQEQGLDAALDAMSREPAAAVAAPERDRGQEQEIER